MPAVLAPVDRRVERGRGIVIGRGRGRGIVIGRGIGRERRDLVVVGQRLLPREAIPMGIETEKRPLW